MGHRLTRLSIDRLTTSSDRKGTSVVRPLRVAAAAGHCSEHDGFVDNQTGIKVRSGADPALPPAALGQRDLKGLTIPSHHFLSKGVNAPSPSAKCCSNSSGRPGCGKRATHQRKICPPHHVFVSSVSIRFGMSFRNRNPYVIRGQPRSFGKISWHPAMHHLAANTAAEKQRERRASKRAPRRL